MPGCTLYNVMHFKNSTYLCLAEFKIRHGTWYMVYTLRCIFYIKKKKQRNVIELELEPNIT